MKLFELVKLDPNLTTAISSVVVAAIALIFTIYQSYLSKKHNRISVTPHLTVWTFEDFTPDFYTVSVELKNDGLGPGIIDNIEIFFGDSSLGTNKDRLKLEESLNEIVSKNIDSFRKSIGIPGKYHVIPAGGRVIIIKFNTTNYIGFDKAPYEDFFRNFRFVVKYQSMYEDKKVCDSSKEY